jgi:hypothetical protein
MIINEKPKVKVTSKIRWLNIAKNNQVKNIFKYGKLKSFSLYKSKAFEK